MESLTNYLRSKFLSQKIYLNQNVFYAITLLSNQVVQNALQVNVKLQQLHSLMKFKLKNYMASQNKETPKKLTKILQLSTIDPAHLQLCLQIQCSDNFSNAKEKVKAALLYLHMNSKDFQCSIGLLANLFLLLKGVVMKKNLKSNKLFRWNKQ